KIQRRDVGEPFGLAWTCTSRRFQRLDPFVQVTCCRNRQAIVTERARTIQVILLGPRSQCDHGGARARITAPPRTPPPPRPPRAIARERARTIQVLLLGPRSQCDHGGRGSRITAAIVTGPRGVVPGSPEAALRQATVEMQSVQLLSERWLGRGSGTAATGER